MTTFMKLEQDKVILPLGNRLIRRMTFIGDPTDVIGGKYDGQEFFGRFNSGGNGVSALWRKIDLGECVNTFEDAKPGDMGKVFWNEYVGKYERGHGIVFTSYDKDN